MLAQQLASWASALAGSEPGAVPGTGGGATLGTPGSYALRLGSNRFNWFLGRFAGCVRSGRFRRCLLSSGQSGVQAASLLTPTTSPPRAGKSGIPEPQSGRGIPGGTGACRVLVATGERGFPCSLPRKSPWAENPAVQRMPNEVQEEKSSLPAETHPDPDLHVCRKKKLGLNRLRAETGSPNLSHERLQ